MGESLTSAQAAEATRARVFAVLEAHIDRLGWESDPTLIDDLIAAVIGTPA